MPEYVYTVVITRSDDETDGKSLGYHDGTDADAIRQLRDEIQEAFDAGHIAGSFNIESRETR